VLFRSASGAQLMLLTSKVFRFAAAMKIGGLFLPIFLSFQSCWCFQATTRSLYCEARKHNGILRRKQIVERWVERTRIYNADQDEVKGKEIKVPEIVEYEKLQYLSFGIEAEESQEEKASRINQRRLDQEELASTKRTNIYVAIASALAAMLQYFYIFTHPVSAIQLLTEMQQRSSPLSSIGHNGKPTVVDFWAPWCESCKIEAPTLYKIESEYKDRINFIMINGDDSASWDLVERFGVDAIPHLALVSSEGDVETALIGVVPGKVLRSDLEVLLINAMIAADSNNEGEAATKRFELPFTMFDAFRTNPEGRRLNF